MPSAQENFYLYRSGHFEYLSGTLARLLGRKGNPFVPRTVVVQSAGAAARFFGPTYFFHSALHAPRHALRHGHRSRRPRPRVPYRLR